MTWRNQLCHNFHSEYVILADNTQQVCEDTNCCNACLHHTCDVSHNLTRDGENASIESISGTDTLSTDIGIWDLDRCMGSGSLYLSS